MLFDKKIFFIFIFLISLTAIAAVSAVENTSDELTTVCEIDDNFSVDEDVLSGVESEEIVSSQDKQENIITDELEAGVNDSENHHSRLAFARTMYDNNLTDFEENSDDVNSLYYLKGLISDSQNTNLTLTNDFGYNVKYDGDYVSGILINKQNFVLDGANHVIDAGAMNRIFNITAANVTLKNIKFINARSSHGAAVYATGENLTIINCTFEDNNATVEAAAVYLKAANGHIYNSTFINNRAQYSGAVLINSVNASVEGSNFINNSADISAGAIGWASKDNGTIKDCIFAENSAYNEGGGAIFWNTANNSKILNSTFHNNYANFNGSAVFWSSLSGIISGSNFIDNCANVSGGALFIKGGNKTIEKSLFRNNSASTGGAIHGLNASLKVLNSYFANNNASLYAGALRVDGGSATFDNTIFENNTGESGGAIYIKKLNNGILSNCIFANNSAQTTGGALESSGSNNLQLNNTTFITNNALTNDGGAAYLKGSNMSILNSYFIANAAFIHGGAVYSTSSDDSVISNCLFENNTAGSFMEGQGGAVNWNGQRVLITHSNFTSNSANESGAVDVLSKDGKITGCIFTNNKATTGGGGAVEVHEKNMSIEDCKFINGFAAKSGGFVYFLSYAVNGTIINCNFTDSVATWGGAIRWQSAKDGKIINSTFVGCRGNSRISDLGGAVYWRTANDGQITGCRFINCSSGLGGSIYNSGRNVIIDNCNFTNSYSVGAGSSVYCGADDLTILKCNFWNSSVSDLSDSITGVIAWVSSTGNIYNCTVSQSNATYALYIDGYYNLDGIVNLENNSFDKPIFMADGNIRSPVSIQILENTTYSVFEDNIVNLEATVKDNSGNIIITRKPLVFVLSNGTELTATSLNDTVWQYSQQMSQPGNYSVSAKLRGLDDAAVNTSAINVITVFDLPKNITSGDDVNVTVVLPNSSYTGDAVLIYDGQINKISVENGVVHYNITKITGGKHSINIVKAGENNELEIISKIFNAKKLAVELEVKVTHVGNNLEVFISNQNLSEESVTVSSDISQSKTLTLNGRGYVYDVIRDVARGNHYVSVSYEGNAFYDAATVVVPFTVEKQFGEANITVPTGFKVGDDINVTVNVSGATGNISAIVDGIETVIALDENGTAIIPIENLTAGEHSIVVVYGGDDKYAGFYNVTTFAVVMMTSKFTNMTVDIEGYIEGVLVDDMGDAIANATIAYKVNGAEANATTDDNGWFILKVKPNSIVEFSYSGNETISPADMAINLMGTSYLRSSTSIVGDNFTQYAIEYKSGERGQNFTTRLVDSMGNPLVNKTVLIGYNGKILTRVTDAAGYVSVQINLKDANRLTFAVAFMGDDEYNATMSVYLITIVKKPVTITASAKTYKVSATKKYTVTLKTIRGASADGKTYFAAGKKVTIKINGKTYTAKTNAKGQATFALNINKRGVFSATIKYAGDNTYEAVSKSVKITVK